MEPITVQEAMRRTINLLGDISVPIKMEESVGKPIRMAIENLYICVDALDKAAEETAEKKEEEAEGK